ncbi:hypothetical protein BC835DRAFT_283140 [Cytidiella melzeri]|nr:hypothetical protein BC835DRAFT_283140 [Cytidiella melzeri]
MFVADGKLEDALGELSFHSPSLDGEDDNNLVHAVYDEQPVEASENLWADYNKAEEPQASDEIICPAHGKKLCPRGICKEYKRLKKAMEREKEAEVKAAEIFEKRNKQKSKGKNLEPKPSNKISYSIPRERPGLSISNKIARGATESPSAPASAPTRAKPAHLLRSTSVDVTADGAPPVRPARGRKMNSNPVITTIPEVKTKIRPKDSDAVSVAASSASGWGNVSRGPWGGSSVGAPSVRDEDDGNDDDDNMTVNGSEKGVGNKSWADQMEEEDDNHSVAASSASGWGTISNGPW